MNTLVLVAAFVAVNGKSTRTEPYKPWKIIGIEKSD
jgi:hypothetical protein